MNKLRKAAERVLAEYDAGLVGFTMAEAMESLRDALEQPVAWSDADADAARLAMELEALLLSCNDTAAVSKWWDSAHDALELHRQRLKALAQREHITDGSPCWCNPEVVYTDPENGASVIVHKEPQ